MTEHKASCHGAAGELQCEPWEHEQQPSVPRRASFDDLHVGQWISVVDGHGTRSWSGHVAIFWPSNSPNEKRWEVHTVKGDDGTGWYVYPGQCNRGEVTILHDAPAPPVTVRREDYDALVAALNHTSDLGTPVDPLAVAARALIDNADTGTTP